MRQRFPLHSPHSVGFLRALGAGAHLISMDHFIHKRLTLQGAGTSSPKYNGPQPEESGQGTLPISLVKNLSSFGFGYLVNPSHWVEEKIDHLLRVLELLE